MTTATTAEHVSHNCAEGRHYRCLGVVSLVPPLTADPEGKRVRCACTACDHEPVTEATQRP